MIENNNYINSTQEEELGIDLLEYAKKLWKARKLLLKVAGIAVIVGVIIAYSIPKEYTVDVTFIPESRKTSSNNRLSGMASMLGIGNLTMGGDANALNAYITSDIVASTPFILDLFDTKVKTLDSEQDITIIEYLDTESVPWWQTLKALPSITINAIRNLFSSNEEAIEKPIDPFQLTPQQMRQVRIIRSKIMAEMDKKTGKTQISVTLQDPLAAAILADTVLVKLQKYITKYKTSKAQEDYDYIEKLYHESKEKYHKAQEMFAKYSDANKNVILQSIRIEQERLQNETNLAYQEYNQFATQLQMALAKLQEEKPAFAVLEPATVPLRPSGTSRKMILVVVVFISVAGAAAWILFGQNLWNNLRQGLSEKKDIAEE